MYVKIMFSYSQEEFNVLQ